LARTICARPRANPPSSPANNPRQTSANKLKLAASRMLIVFTTTVALGHFVWASTFYGISCGPVRSTVINPCGPVRSTAFRVSQYFLRHFMWAGAFYGIPCGPVLSTAMLWANTHAARFMRSCIGLNRSSTHTHARTHASTHAHTHARTLTATHSQLYPPTPTQTQHKHHAYQACEAFIHTSCSFKHHAYQACEAFIHTSCSFTHHAYQACEAFRPQHLEPNGIMH